MNMRASEKIAGALLNLHLDPAEASSWVEAVRYARITRKPSARTLEAARSAVRDRLAERPDPVVLGSMKVRRR